MQILLTIHIGNVWVMLWELIATSAIVWAKYKMPCSPSYLWVEFEVTTFTVNTFRSERVIRMFVGIVYAHLFCTCHFHHTWVVSLWQYRYQSKNANVFSRSTQSWERRAYQTYYGIYNCGSFDELQRYCSFRCLVTISLCWVPNNTYLVFTGSRPEDFPSHDSELTWSLCLCKTSQHHLHALLMQTTIINWYKEEKIGPHGSAVE